MASPLRRCKPLRVGIYGGSFNPITNAHLNTAAELIHSKKADEVWVTPCGPRPDKASLTVSTLDRYVMCQLAVSTTFGSRFGVKVSSIELSRDVAMGSFSIMRAFKAAHPDKEFFFILGEDLIEGLEGWTDPECEDPARAGVMLKKENKFLVIKRPGFTVAPELRASLSNFEWVSPGLEGSTLVSMELSSSEIRHRFNGGRKAEEARARSSLTGSAQKALRADVARERSGSGSAPLSPRGESSGGRPRRDSAAPSADDEVRDAMSAGNWYSEAEGLVPPAVLSHIARYRLYAEEADAGCARC
jgi:nicotinate-nucleotide adenylyltransferase